MVGVVGVGVGHLVGLVEVGSRGGNGCSVGGGGSGKRGVAKPSLGFGGVVNVLVRAPFWGWLQLHPIAG